MSASTPTAARKRTTRDLVHRHQQRQLGLQPPSAYASISKVHRRSAVNDNKRHATRKSGPGSGAPKSARASDPQQVRTDELTSIASQHLERGRFIEALETVLQALAQRETPAAKAVFIGCFRHCRFSGDVPELRAVVARAVSQAWGRFDEFSAGATNLAKHGPQIAAAIARVAKAWPNLLNGDDLWTAAQRTAICSDPLLLALMEATSVADLDLERLLTNARFALLQHALTPAATVERHLLAFYCLVARQCFTNEYVFTATADEIAHVRQLQHSLLAALNSKANVPVLWLVAVAAYLPLHRAGANTEPLLRRNWPRVVSELLNQQISAPLEEARLRTTIRAITPIDTAVSLAVREQYEENPFPRWVKSPGQLVPRSVEEAMRILFPTATL